MLLKFSKNISDQLHRCQISLVGPRILKYHQGMTQFNSIIKKFAFQQSMKAIKKQLKIKSEFSFNRASTETIKKNHI